ncbi:DUF1353 domain-containing protein [Paraburkholderia phenoliruptrix]|uniref:DUF1353 domain-containing protein n=1 Tax=Paraburkholderia phenoliruptrix TaxID=252970 RepID=UPI003D962799
MKPATGKDDGQWELLADLIYQSDVAGRRFTVPAGFITNFASVPRIPIVYELAGDTASNAATVHDYLYSTHIVSRSVADSVLREASAVTDVPDWRRQLMWAGVRLFGWLYWGGAATSTKPAAKAAVTQPVPAN